jgi:hypothetical protein
MIRATRRSLLADLFYFDVAASLYAGVFCITPK